MSDYHPTKKPFDGMVVLKYRKDPGAPKKPFDGMVTLKYGKGTVAATTTTTTTPADQATTAATAQVLLGVMDSVPEAEDACTEK